jgi:hypothetical protein
MKHLTEHEAYLAMYSFLEHQWKLRGSDDLAALLGDLSLLPSGSSADPAMKEDWAAAVSAAVSGDVDARLQLTK